MTEIKYNTEELEDMEEIHPTDEEMEMLKDYYQRENVEFEVKSDEELPF